MLHFASLLVCIQNEQASRARNLANTYACIIQQLTVGRAKV